MVAIRVGSAVVPQRIRHLRSIFIEHLAGIEGYQNAGIAGPTLVVLMDHKVLHDALVLRTNPYGCSEAG